MNHDQSHLITNCISIFPIGVDVDIGIDVDNQLKQLPSPCPDYCFLSLPFRSPKSIWQEGGGVNDEQWATMGQRFHHSLTTNMFFIVYHRLLWTCAIPICCPCVYVFQKCFELFNYLFILCVCVCSSSPNQYIQLMQDSRVMVLATSTLCSPPPPSHVFPHGAFWKAHSHSPCAAPIIPSLLMFSIFLVEHQTLINLSLRSRQ